VAILTIATLAVCAAARGAPLAAAVLGSVTILLVLRAAGDAAAAMNCIVVVLRAYCDQVQKAPGPAPAPAAQVQPQPSPRDEAMPDELEHVLEASGGRT
jgi:hypothetical protein